MTTMTRGALLISNAGEPGDEHYCKGVFADIKNYRAYLCEPHGGWWADSEITRLDRPSVKEVRLAVANLRGHDYSFVAFSGHGWYSRPDNATVLTLRRGEQIKYYELLEGATRRTLVLDCCREVSPDAVQAVAKYAMAQRAPRTPNGARCREEFFSAVSSASKGSVVAYSCSTGETAGDDEMRGGRYTASLLSVGTAWAEAAASGFQSTPAHASIVHVHEGAASETKRRSGDLQNPTIEKPRTQGPYFPFAVFAA